MIENTVKSAAADLEALQTTIELIVNARKSPKSKDN